MYIYVHIYGFSVKAFCPDQLLMVTHGQTFMVTHGPLGRDTPTRSRFSGKFTSGVQEGKVRSERGLGQGAWDQWECCRCIASNSFRRSRGQLCIRPVDWVLDVCTTPSRAVRFGQGDSVIGTKPRSLPHNRLVLGLHQRTECPTTRSYLVSSSSY